MNKPATQGAPHAWHEKDVVPRWYLWEGGFLVMGKAAGEVPDHTHHAIQLQVAIEGRMAIRAPGQPWRETAGVIVRADVEHSFDARGATGALMMLDPESTEGAWLNGALAEDITLVPDARLAACASALKTLMERPFEAMEVGEFVRYWVQSMAIAGFPSRRPDPRVGTVLAAIQASEDLRMSLEAAAELVHLSPGRFAHLFKDELGLPFRRYMLWRKVTRAMVSVGRGRALAAAAQNGDFADAAHLTRTFNQMFGIPPSAFMRGDFFEIPSPFTVQSAGLPLPRSAS